MHFYGWSTVAFDINKKFYHQLIAKGYEVAHVLRVSVIQAEQKDNETFSEYGTFFYLTIFCFTSGAVSLAEIYRTMILLVKLPDGVIVAVMHVMNSLAI